MDEGLRNLQRRVEADDADVDLAARYDVALTRAGRFAEVARRYRFKFRCPLAFEDLKPTEDPFVRACDRCRKNTQGIGLRP